jgi:ectoine hydroxylase-related dioxygenase (phytanoyl-CoA dioxygenase family)
MKKQLIKDKDYEDSLSELGFCIAPLFDEAQIDAVKKLYLQFSTTNKVSGLIASHSKTDPELSIQISESLKDIVMPSLNGWFDDFDFFIGGFMVKEANTPSEFPLHQDWNIVDEGIYTSYQIWIPLELSSIYNGGIFVLPGSHRFFNNSRSGSYGMPRINTDPSLRDLCVDMTIPPGSALIYHNSLFHASHPNRSNNNRISAIINIYEKKAPLTYTHKNNSLNQSERYAINNRLFLTHLNVLEKGEVPNEFNPPLGTSQIESFNNTDVKSNDLIARFNRCFPEGKEGFEPFQLHILKSKDIEDKIKKDGYVTLDFLEPETVQCLVEEYNKLFESSNTAIGRFTPMEHASPEAKRFIHDFILVKIRSKLDYLFKDYQTPISSFFTKYAHSAGDLSWHQDASILLNTHLEPHYGIWCPLIDVNEKNGAFCLIEKSHKFSHSVFLAGLTWPFFNYGPFFDATKKITPLQAGQIVLFDMRMIHHALPNTTDQDRVVFCVRLTHKKSKYYSFEHIDPKEQSVTVFEEKPDYYLRDDWTGENQAANQLKKIGTMTGIYNNINYNTIEAVLRSNKKLISID